MLTKFWKSLQDALRGLRTVWREENNFQIELVIAAVVIIVALLFRFSLVEFSLLFVAVIIVLSGEILNTALEDLCDKVEPQYDAVIGKIKDTAAAFVLVSSFGAAVLGIAVFVHHFVY